MPSDKLCAILECPNKRYKDDLHCYGHRPPPKRNRPIEPGEECYICAGPATERDHFPTPKTMGGRFTMPICRGCHDAKDRIPLHKWPVGTWGCLAGLWEKADVNERRILVKIYSIAGKAFSMTSSKRYAHK